jgi:crotonobetainyl-CoA:carnitine CoA-transferase CaiB-like acyl-CoA transferase
LGSRRFADWGANVIKIDALLEEVACEQPGKNAAVSVAE